MQLNLGPALRTTVLGHPKILVLIRVVFPAGQISTLDHSFPGTSLGPTILSHFRQGENKVALLVGVVTYESSKFGMGMNMFL